MSLRNKLRNRVTVQLPYRNVDDDYVPVVDVLSVLTERGFESRAFVQGMHVHLVQEQVYLEVMVACKIPLPDPATGINMVLHRRPVHSIYDDRVSYQCFYGLARADSPDVPVYWIGVGMRLRNGKTRHFPAPAALDNDLDAQFAAMCQQDPGK